MTDSSGEERRLSNGAFYGKQRWFRYRPPRRDGQTASALVHARHRSRERYASVHGLLVSFDDGEGGVDVADVVPIRHAVEVEVERVQLGAQVKAALGIPAEWRLDLVLPSSTWPISRANRVSCRAPCR